MVDGRAIMRTKFLAITSLVHHRTLRMVLRAALREAMAERAQELFAVPAPTGALVEQMQRLPILFLPVWDGHEAPAVLCLGPKRSGDRYTPQDQALLGTLARHLAVVFANKRLRAQLNEQMVALHRLAEERTVLAEVLPSAA